LKFESCENSNRTPRADGILCGAKEKILNMNIPIPTSVRAEFKGDSVIPGSLPLIVEKSRF
jgi:hypothetical protein